MQGQHVVGRDALVGELAEAGVDAVKGFAAFEELDDAAASLLDAATGGGGKAEALDAAVQNGVGVGEGQIVAGQCKDGGGSDGAGHVTLNLSKNSFG